MKTSRFRRTTLIFSTILLILAYSYFHAIATETSFILALDQIILDIADGLWKFFSTPAIFIAFLLFILIMQFRENIISLFPAIREIKAGSFSAVLNSPLVELDQHTNTSKTDMNRQIRTEKNTINSGDTFQKILLEKLPTDYLKLLLEIDQKNISVSQFSEIMTSVRLEDGLKKRWSQLNGVNIYYFHYGIIVALRKFLVPSILKESVSDSTYSAYFSLEAGVKEKILKILNENGEIIK